MWFILTKTLTIIITFLFSYGVQTILLKHIVLFYSTDLRSSYWLFVPVMFQNDAKHFHRDERIDILKTT